jgi:hypothetical protein
MLPPSIFKILMLPSVAGSARGGCAISQPDNQILSTLGGSSIGSYPGVQALMIYHPFATRTPCVIIMS